MTGAFQVLSRGMPFEEAIAYFRQKVNLPTETWMDIWEGMHARAFVVAGAMKDALLVDLRSAVDKAISQGTGLDEFRRDFDELVARNGWSYRGGRNWRSRVIFETNLRTAYQAGHWKAMTDPRVKERRPFMRYVAVLDSRTRPLHRAWHNTVLPKDDPWWNTHYPPNGWGCRCTTVDHDAEEIEELRKEGEHLTTSAPPMNMREVDGLPVPEGIDPGWAYNVGTAAWGEGAAKAILTKGPFEEVPGLGPPDYPWLPRSLIPREPPVPPGPRLHSAEELRAALPVGTFQDVTGQWVNVTHAITDHILEDPEKRWNGREQYFPLIPYILRDPSELWFGFVRFGDGSYAIRRRYVTAYAVGPKKRVVGVLADTIGGQLVAFDVIHGSNLTGGRLRYGRLAYPWEPR